eukprot:7218318-Pyramimonas_sp.AAC.2
MGKTFGAGSDNLPNTGLASKVPPFKSGPSMAVGLKAGATWHALAAEKASAAIGQRHQVASLPVLRRGPEDGPRGTI